MPATRPIQALVRLLLAVLVAGPLISGCGAGAAGGEDGGAGATTSLAPRDFAEEMVEPGTVLLDVRTPEEFAAGHIEGARNLPLESDDFAAQVARLDPERTYAVYCRTDRRSGAALEVMAEHGLTDAYDLDGGMEAWQQHGGAVVPDPAG